jgi:hypothetical protein
MATAFRLRASGVTTSPLPAARSGTGGCTAPPHEPSTRPIPTPPCPAKPGGRPECLRRGGAATVLFAALVSDSRLCGKCASGAVALSAIPEHRSGHHRQGPPHREPRLFPLRGTMLVTVGRVEPSRRAEPAKLTFVTLCIQRLGCCCPSLPAGWIPTFRSCFAGRSTGLDGRKVQAAWGPLCMRT